MKKIYFSLIAIITFTFANAQIVNIPDANFKAKLLEADASNTIAQNLSFNYFKIDQNNNGEIEMSEAMQVSYLNISDSAISDLTGINSFISLFDLTCDNNQLTSLDVSNLVNLQSLFCDDNQLLTSLDVSNLVNLQSLSCYNNQLTSLDVGNLVNLQYLDCDDNQLTSLDVSNLVNLQSLYCAANQLTSLDVSNLVNLYYLSCVNNQLTSLDVSNLVNLYNLYCNDNQLASLDVSNLVNLYRLDCYDNQLTSLDVSNLVNLIFLSCSSNPLTSLDVSNLVNLLNLYCGDNQLTSLDVNNLVNLNTLYCSSNQLIFLDVSNFLILSNLSCDDNALTSLFIKNNNSTWPLLSFSGNPNLQYICADDEDVTLVQNKINQYGYTNCHVNSYCSFTPGGTFYTIQGNNHLDSDNNGCDANDINYPNLKFNITDETISGTLISNSSGSYIIPVSAGTHTFTPQLENPSYFTVSPTTATVSFPTTASPYSQDFCITANGVHYDLETVIIPLNAARPGFNASYKIKYKNKGNQLEMASISFNYNDNILDFVSTSVTPTSQNIGVLNWNLGTLNPFQEGEIMVTLNLNSPTENPPVNAGNVLNYVSNISSTNTDETPSDNSSTLNQTVVNSFDPNDKTCLEGNTINSSMIGEYLHYMIRFENSGTFPAENIVVKDMIDTTKFDVATLQMTDASHTCYTRINGNKVEFIFENINLDFNDATNDGYVVFKIKTLPTLAVNAQVTNNANIYFDYNFPITTNTATSTFTTLANNSFDFDTYFTLAPIPAKNILTISNKQNAAISSISIYSILGQVVLTSTNPSETIDVSSLKTGNYFIKINSDKGISSSKFVKE